MEPLNIVDNIYEDKIVRAPNLEYTPEAGGMGTSFFKQMSSHGNATAQIDGLTGEKDSYNSLLQRCVRTAIEMRSRGITPKDIVTICSFNHMNSCVPFISSLFLAAKTASLDPTISLADTNHLLKQIHPKMIFVGPEAVTLIENALAETQIKAEIVVFGESSKYSRFSEFLEVSHEENHFRPVEVADLKETVAIFFSSGTTGLPKGICINHLSLLSQGFQFGPSGIGCNTEIFLSFSSMYWISSALIITCCIYNKGCRVVVPRYDQNIVWELISNLKVTIMFLSPSQAVAMYKKGRPDGVDTTYFSDFLIGGGFISERQLKDMKGVLPETRINVGYGQTELTGCCTLFQPNSSKDRERMEKKLGSSGRPLPGFSVKVVDPDTEEILGPNQEGELRVKTEFQMKGYYGTDSSDVWDSDGWLKTGDVGYYDKDHCFYIVDRIKEMLKFQSWHVPPAILESVILTHPKVATAVVIGLPHPEDGDHVMGVVTLKNSDDNVTEDEIEQYVAEKVDDRQRLRGGVKIISSIPMTPTGKVKRRDIRNMMLQGIL